jgi:hypothetical protein
MELISYLVSYLVILSLLNSNPSRGNVILSDGFVVPLAPTGKRQHECKLINHFFIQSYLLASKSQTLLLKLINKFMKRSDRLRKYSKLQMFYIYGKILLRAKF